jgi:hypothetical protein
MKPVEETPVWQPGQPTLLDRVRERCRVRHLSERTEHAYVGWNRRFCCCTTIAIGCGCERRRSRHS